MPKIFLSPSTQQWNLYVNGGTEEQYMNLIADKNEPYLRSSGIQYVRNNPAGDAKGAIRDSNSTYYDAHFAIHSNAASGEFSGKLRGIDVFYSPYSSESKRLASITANNLEMIYPIPSKVRIVPTTSLGEVTRTKAVAILSEIGYHDNPSDAAWIKANLNPIARNMVQALTQYFGIPFVEATPVRKGVVVTDGSNLNIRSYPSMSGKILGVIPNGAELNVYGSTGEWYVIKYGSTTGYSAQDFIEIK